MEDGGPPPASLRCFRRRRAEDQVDPSGRLCSRSCSPSMAASISPSAARDAAVRSAAGVLPPMYSSSMKGSRAAAEERWPRRAALRVL